MKTILLTGSTGVLGSRILVELLALEETSIICLVRPNNEGEALERITKILDFYHTGKDELRRIRCFSGDLTQINCGLSQEHIEEVARDVTHIIHAASDLHLNLTPEESVAKIVQPTLNILKLSKLIRDRSAGSVRFSHISTVGVGGQLRIPLSEELVSVPRRFRNTYEEGKARAEELVVDHCEGKIPYLIFRPSMIVGDSQTGEILYFQVFYYICELLSGLRTNGLLPQLGKVKLDTVPVDYVARAVVKATLLPENRKVYHLCSGESSITLEDLENTVDQVYRCLGTCLKPRKHLPVFFFKLAAVFLKPFMSDKRQRLLEKFPYFLRYLQTLQLFENAQSEFYLSKFEIVRPAVATYLPRAIEYYLKHIFKERASP